MNMSGPRRQGSSRSRHDAALAGVGFEITSHWRDPTARPHFSRLGMVLEPILQPILHRVMRKRRDWVLQPPQAGG
jgi:hypothetical protein